MWYKVPNYTMKCRIYPNKSQQEIIDKILHGIRVAYNVTMYEMITNLKNTKETKDKKENKTIHFPQFSSMVKKEWLDYLRTNYPAVKEVPLAVLALLFMVFFLAMLKRLGNLWAKSLLNFISLFSILLRSLVPVTLIKKHFLNFLFLTPIKIFFTLILINWVK